MAERTNARRLEGRRVVQHGAVPMRLVGAATREQHVAGGHLDIIHEGIRILDVARACRDARLARIERDLDHADAH